MEKQSFSYHAKEEILEKINTKAKADVCLMGILVFCNILSDREIVFLTEHSSVADFFASNCRRICGNENAVDISQIGKKNEVTLYRLEICGEESRLELLEYFRMDSSRRLTQDDLPKKEILSSAYCGNISCLRFGKQS